MKHKLISVQFIFSLALVVAVSVIPAIAQWNEPPEGTVAPANNAPAPINVGASTQSKEGNLVLNAGGIFASGLLVPRGDITVGNPVNDATMGASAKVKAFGNVWADKYCDRDGGNCYTSTEMAGGGGGVTKIIAGSGIVVTPSSGVGEVTVSRATLGDVYAKSISGRRVDVYCDAGDIATGGGSRNGNQGDVHSTHPIKAGGVIPANGEAATGWHCLTENNDNCFVMCLNSNASGPGAAPTVDLNANPTQVTNCGGFLQSRCTTTLTWTSTGANTCNASGGWAGSKAPNGSEVQSWTGTANRTFVLTCTSDAGNGSDSVTVVHN